jgi:putative SOS response-associated peptidase YedK
MLDPFSNFKCHKFARRELIPLSSYALWRIDAGYARTITWDEDGMMVTLGFWRAGDVVGQVLSSINPWQSICTILTFSKPTNYCELFTLVELIRDC